MDVFFNELYQKPHIVILGAGASCATILNGDKNGNKIYAMADFIDKLKLNDIIAPIKFKTDSRNLEDIYSELYERNDFECIKVREQLETKIESYFKCLILPDNPTIYDFILLSLRKKDLIISFNWDDLLLQARKRVQKITQDLPQMVFLHGNIGVGYCENDNDYGLVENRCRKCNSQYKQSKLLFPIKKKDYNSTQQLHAQWEIAESYIKDAGYITIFGYGLPDTDIEVKELFLKAFNHNTVEYRFFENIEIIDKPGCDENILYNRWSEFIKITHEHYNIESSIFNSTLMQNPRRTIENHINSNIKGNWNIQSTIVFKENMSFEDLEACFKSVFK